MSRVRIALPAFKVSFSPVIIVGKRQVSNPAIWQMGRCRSLHPSGFLCSSSLLVKILGDVGVAHITQNLYVTTTTFYAELIETGRMKLYISSVAF
jgi:hypothetical protein